MVKGFGGCFVDGRGVVGYGLSGSDEHLSGAGAATSRLGAESITPPGESAAQSCLHLGSDFADLLASQHSLDVTKPVLCVFYAHWRCLQCFDAVGWAAGRASGL